MNDAHVPYRASGFFILRTPSLPFARFTTRRANTTVGDLLSTEPFLYEGVAAASSSLLQAIRGDLSASPRRAAKALASLLRYHTRMATRSTPFGLFAAVTYGRVEAATKLDVGASTDSRVEIRLDADILETLLGVGAHTPNLNLDAVYSTNDSAHRCGSRILYCGRTPGNGSGGTAAVIWQCREHLSYLQFMTGPRPLAELFRQLVRDGYPPATAEAYIRDLIEHELIVPKRGLLIVGRTLISPGPDASYPAPSRVQRIRDLTANVGELGRQRGDAFSRSLDEVRERIAALWPSDRPMPRSVVHIDQFRDSHVAISDAAARHIGSGCYEVQRLLGKEASSVGALVHAFTERYSDAFVPLSEIVDPEIRLYTHAGRMQPGARGSDFDRLTPEAQERLCDAIINRQNVVVLSADDFQELPAPAPLDNEYRVAWSAHVSVLAKRPEELDSGQFVFQLHGIYGPSGTEPVARFAYAIPGLREAIVRHHEIEQTLVPSTLTEVVHRPEGRMANVMHRPQLRSVEIVFLGNSDTRARKLHVDGLYVTVRDGRIWIYSDKLKQFVIPRLTTAHNFSNAANYGLYRFLGLVARQDAFSVGFDWGTMNNMPYQPRLQIGTVIVSPARWHITRAAIDHGIRSGFDTWLSKLVAARQLPRYVHIGSYDQRLVIDLTRQSDRGELARWLRGRQEGGSVLSEFVGFEGSIVRDAVGHAYCHEMVVPFVRSSAPGGSASRRVGPQNVRGIARVPRPDHLDAWLQLNVYTGRVNADVILAEYLRAVVDAELCTGSVDRWFFIRYSDPEFHLRIRVRGAESRSPDLHVRLDRFVSRLRHERLIWDHTYSVYRPEVWRYGGPQGIEQAERIFNVDSTLVVALLGRAGAPSEEERQLAAITALHGIFEAFGLTCKERVACLSAGGKWPQLYKDLRPRIQTCVPVIDNRGGNPDAMIASGSWARWREEVSASGAEYRQLARVGAICRPLSEIANAICHMHVNRVAAEATGVMERRVRYLLARRYQELIGRGVTTNASWQLDGVS